MLQIEDSPLHTLVIVLKKGCPDMSFLELRFSLYG